MLDLCAGHRVQLAMGSSWLCLHIIRLLCLISVVTVISLGLHVYLQKTTDDSRSPEPVLVSRRNEKPLGRRYGSERYVNNLEKCLDTSNLTEYFQREGFLTKAVTNVMHYLGTIRNFIPDNFIPSLPNHCWNAAVELDFSPSLVSGHLNGTNFRVNRTYFQNPPPSFELLNLLHGKSKTDYPKNHSMPFSCIPEVFLAGFYKCGSTSLYFLMNSHPAFAKPRAHWKEPDWLTKIEHFFNENGKKVAFFADYVVNYESLVMSLATQSSGNVQYPLGLDGSAGMLLHWPTFFEQERIVNFCLLPSVIPEVLPKAKFVVIMREPASMMYSFFWLTCTRYNQAAPSLETQLKGPDVFHERVMDGIRAIKSCITDFSLAKCLTDSANRPDTFQPLMPKCGEVNFGIYAALYYVHIQKWLSVAPRERFLFLTLEELSENERRTANQVWSFLKVPPLPRHHKIVHVRNKQVSIDYENDPRLAMRSDTREILKSFFRPYNQMLADLLGNKKFLWKQSKY